MSGDLLDIAETEHLFFYVKPPMHADPDVKSGQVPADNWTTKAEGHQESNYELRFTNY